MASGTSSHTSPESRAIRQHYSNLQKAIRDPLGLSAELFSKHLIDDETMEKARLMPQTIKEKADVLLIEVNRTVNAQPRLFHDFVKVLNEDELLQKVAETLEATYCKQFL